MRYSFAQTPIGPLLAAHGPDEALTGLWFGREPRPEWRRDDTSRVVGALREQLASYFAGELRRFDLPLGAIGTPWQRSVWTALAGVPYGETLTYGELAGRLGRPAAARAVGAANGRNPVSIVVPCHRVVGSTGWLTGYAGGLTTKEQLLAHERSVSEPSPPADFASVPRLR